MVFDPHAIVGQVRVPALQFLGERYSCSPVRESVDSLRPENADA
jgi:hypothetical protein